MFAPSLIGSGMSINITKAYRPQLFIGWCLLIIGMGTLSTVRADSPLGQPLGFSALFDIGCGIIYAATYFPVLAPLNISDNAYALAFFAYCRQFATVSPFVGVASIASPDRRSQKVWGIAIGGAVLQNQLHHKLPEDFVESLPSGVALAFSAIPEIAKLQDPVRSQVEKAFGEAFSVIWQVMAGITAIGLIASVFMKALPLHTQVDERWGLERDQSDKEGGDIPMKGSNVSVTVDDAAEGAPESVP